MRANISSVVRDMRAEHAANRLSWDVVDVKRSIRPYPKTKQYKRPLGEWGDDTWTLGGGCLYAEDGEEKSGDAEGEQDSEHELNEEEEDAADLTALGAISGIGHTEVACSSGYCHVDDVNSWGEPILIGCGFTLTYGHSSCTYRTS